LSQLLEYARKYQEHRPGQIRLVFIGQGEVAIPPEEWAQDRGFVSAEVKRTIIGGAAALVQLSRQESLSLVALEAWALGVPVIADQGCEVLAGHLSSCGGGRAIDGFAGFAQALDDLHDHPDEWRRMGQRGREYVHRQYGSNEKFVEPIVQAITRLHTSWVKQCDDWPTALGPNLQAKVDKVGEYWHLPTDCGDSSQGVLARLKNWFKRKLFQSFKITYVDVIVRRQSVVNEELLETVTRLADRCATLDHAVQVLQKKMSRLEGLAKSPITKPRKNESMK
jgi:hypothetical protein